MNTIGLNNTATGSYTLSNNTSGERNTAFGALALANNVTGSANTALGYQALVGVSSGNSNTAGGYQSGYALTSGTANTLYGWRSGALIGTANDNAIFGYDAGSSATGGENTLIGSYAGHSMTGGTQNTYIGRQTDGALTSLTNSTALGYGTSVSASNKVRLGNSSVTVIEGQVSFTSPSDARFKENIQDDVQGLDFIMKLRPVSYNFNRLSFAKHIKENTEGREEELTALSKIRSVGFLAQDVEKLVQQNNFTGFDAVHAPTNENDNYGISYSQFVIPLVKAVQEQQKTIEELKKKIERLESK